MYMYVYMSVSNPNNLEVIFLPSTNNAKVINCSAILPRTFTTIYNLKPNHNHGDRLSKHIGDSYLMMITITIMTITLKEGDDRYDPYNYYNHDNYDHDDRDDKAERCQ